MVASVEAFVGIRMQNSGLGNPPVLQWGETIPSHLRALTTTDQNAPPQSAYATPENAQLTRVAGHRVVLVVTLQDLPKPLADLTRTMMPPMLKLSLNRLKLRHHYGLCGPVLLQRARRTGDLPVLVHVVSQRARVLRLRRTQQPLAFDAAAVLPSSSRNGVGILFHRVFEAQ